MDDNALSQLITWAAALCFAGSAWATFWIWRARRGGWAGIAAAYAAKGKPEGAMARRWQSFRLMPGRINYPGLITLRVTIDGLMAVPALPVRFGHDAVMLPWDDIEIFAVDTYPADRLYDLQLARVPGVKIRIGVATAQLIRRAADNSRYFAEQTPTVRALPGPAPTAAKALRPRQSVA